MSIVAGFMVPHPPMIVPAVGRGTEAVVEETTRAYRDVAKRIAEIAPDTIIITSPHSVMYADYFHVSPGEGAEGDFGRFGAPGVSFDEAYDYEFVDKLTELAVERDFPAGIEGERDSRLDHGTMVPLYFIRQYYSGGKIIRIGLSGLSLAQHYRLGMMIREACDALGRKAVFVASGDLSHKLKEDGPYGYVPEGPLYDERIMDAAGRAAFGEMLSFDETFCDKAAECGHRSFVIMGGAFDGRSVAAEVLSHQDVTGVGYGITVFTPKTENPNRCFLEEMLRQIEAEREQSDAYVTLARLSMEHYIKTGEELHLYEDVPEELMSSMPEELRNKQAGAFVSIHKEGQLRGCIGTIGPTTDCLAEEIVQNAVSASARDHRFSPITEDELPWLTIHVDVLGEPEYIDTKDELDVKRYGVIVTSGYKRGLLLPDLEGVDDVETQVSIAMRKGGISPAEDYRLQRFEVIRHT